MRVLFLNDYDSSFLQNQINDLKKKNDIEIYFDVHIGSWTYFRDSKHNPEKVRNKFSEYSLEDKFYSLTVYPSLPKHIMQSVSSRLIYFLLKKKYHSLKFDVIHAQNGYPSGHAAMLLSKAWGIPYIITSHGADSYKCYPNSIEMGGARMQKTSVLRLHKKALLNASSVIGVSKPFTEFVRKIQPQANCITIQNSYNGNIFNTNEPKLSRHDFNLRDEDFVVLSVGFFIKRKAHSDIIKAIAMLNSPNIKLILVGGGPLKNELILQAEELGIDKKLTIINHIHQRKLVDLYKISDVMVFPSLYEPFGLALVEAMACGLPVIATRTWGPLDIIKDRDTGLLVDKSSPHDIKEALEMLINEPDMKAQLSKNAAKSVEERFLGKNTELYNHYKATVMMYKSKGPLNRVEGLK